VISIARSKKKKKKKKGKKTATARIRIRGRRPSTGLPLKGGHEQKARGEKKLAHARDVPEIVAGHFGTQEPRTVQVLFGQRAVSVTNNYPDCYLR